MRIMVTGGCGFIGSAVIRYAIGAMGATVLNVDKLTYAATPEALEDIAASGRYSFLHADICDAAALTQAFTGFAPDAVMHLAAESHVDRSIDGPQAFVNTNLVGTSTLLEAARRYWSKLDTLSQRRFRFHHVSTDEVYGSLDVAAPGFTEMTPYQPRSPYSASKTGSDHLVRAWGETFGLLWEVLTKGRAGETYNIGGMAERRNIDVVVAVCRLMDERFPDRGPHERLIRFVTDRPGHDLRYAIDTGKVRDELGWAPAVDVETGLASTLDWYLAHEFWWQRILARNGDGGRQGVLAEPRCAAG